MRIDWGKLSTNGGRSSAWTTGLAVIATALLASACHHYGTQAASPPVAVGAPAKVSDKLDNAQTAYINSLRTLAIDYDTAVCEEQDKMAQSAHESQAVNEANLEVADAWMTAKQSVQSRRGGGPLETGGGPSEQGSESAEQGTESATDGEGIVVFKVEPPQEKRDRGGWSCQNASGEPACVAASASGAARKVYHDFIGGRDINPVTVGDIFEAFAADAAWADHFLVGAATQAKAYAQIEDACNAGDSPLARFFGAAADFDHPEVRRDLLAVRDDFVGVQQNVCDALPVYYENLLNELRTDLSMRIRNNRCSAQRWDAMWE